MNWLSNLKVGDTVWQVERHPTFPNGVWRWQAKVVAIESSHIETEYCRDYKCEWLIELCKDLAPNHRAYHTTWLKNYYAPDGSINIEECK